MHAALESLEHALTITSFVFAMMVLVDYVNVLTKGGMSRAIRGNGFRQYTVTSFLGATPGCLGAFMSVSFYIRGIITFGAITGTMIATCGDESFIMLALFPGKALILFATLFLIGIISAPIVDRIAKVLKIKTCDGCGHADIHLNDRCRVSNFQEIINQFKKLSMIRFLLMALLGVFLYLFISGQIGPEIWDWKRITFTSLISLTLLIIVTVPEHYLEVHIWQHIAKRHLWRILLWSFGALFVVHVGLENFNLESYVESHMMWVLLLALLLGLIPESGPHLIFVILFSKGMIPFSVLLASSIVQDGHGILPLLSHSIKDSILIKAFSLVIAAIIGIVLYSLGI